MKPRSIYLLLAITGFVVPYSQFIPWIIEHGLDMRLFVEHLFANRISAFFGLDVLISAVVVCVFARAERTRLGSAWWAPAAAVLLVGVSLGLPLLLYLREAPHRSFK